jgi:hypothetical protein
LRAEQDKLSPKPSRVSALFAPPALSKESIGIEKGQPFSPDEQLRDALEL